MPTLTAPSPETPSEGVPPLASHFDTLEQQHDSVLLGMWIFLATEVMFFGGAFATYVVYRHANSAAFHEASRTLDLTLGTVNTLVLLTSSLTMALAVAFSAQGRRWATVGSLLATLVLGAAFLAIKAGEYHHKYEEHHLPALGLPFDWPPEQAHGAQLFFSLYLAMTGMHALHMLIGLGALGVFVAMSLRAKNVASRQHGIELLGLYWHFVDIVWIFLFPLLYLIDRT